MDESGEIRCTAFRDAVDKYYDMIQVRVAGRMACLCFTNESQRMISESMNNRLIMRGFNIGFLIDVNTEW